MNFLVILVEEDPGVTKASVTARLPELSAKFSLTYVGAALQQQLLNVCRLSILGF